MTVKELKNLKEVPELVKNRVLEIAEMIHERNKTPMEVAIKNTLHAYTYPTKY